jgi:hypothetical protein
MDLDSVNRLLRGPPRSVVSVEVARGWAELPIRAEIRCALAVIMHAYAYVYMPK